jgi:hypothetical protein
MHPNLFFGQEGAMHPNLFRCIAPSFQFFAINETQKVQPKKCHAPGVD